MMEVAVWGKGDARGAKMPPSMQREMHERRAMKNNNNDNSDSSRPGSANSRRG
jgi:hypothetical protein